MNIPDKSLRSLSPKQRYDMLARLRQTSEPVTAESMPRISRRDDRSQAFPLSAGQAGLWFLARVEGGSNYNEFIAFRIDGKLDVSALTRSLSELVRRHEALRTVFPEIDGKPAQIIVTDAPFAPEIVNLEGLADPGMERKVEALVEAEARRPFDLLEGPVFRAILLRLAPSRHVLMLSMHHIVCDRWSADVLAHELAASFTAFAAAASPSLPEVAIQFADYAAWQHDRIAAGAVDHQLAYWREQLAGAPALMALPMSRPRRDALSHCGARVPVRLSSRLTAAIKTLARQRGVTPFIALYAVFALLLARLSGQDDVVVGAPVANRDMPELRGLVGFLVNMLPLRLRLADAMTGRQLLETARSVATAAFANRDVPIERLVEELGIKRAPQHSPLFQATFTLQNEASEPLRLDGLTVSPVKTSFTPAKFDLSMFLEERDNSFCGYLEYRTDLFDQDAAQTIRDRFLQLTDALVAAPDREIEAASLLLPGERERLCEWGRNPRPYPRDATLGELFALEAASRPEATALTIGDERVSYGELEARVNRLAHCLIARLGPMQDRLVGLLLERSSDLIVAMLAVVRAGGAYLPLDLNAPAERLGFMLADAEALAVLSAGAVAAAAPAGAAPVILLDEEAAAIAACPSTPPPRTAAAESPAYVMYTSGSTGRPKGVCVSHRAVVRLVKNTDYISIGPGDRIAHGSNVAFDASTFEVFGALLNGATVDVLAREELLDPAVFARQARGRRFNILFLTTALFNRLTDLDAGVFAGLDYLLFGGEAVDVRRVAAVIASGAPRHLLHVYGPTESTTFATWHPATAADVRAGSIPIGRPIANTTAYVLDAWGGLAATGVAGELHLGGDGLASAYLNQPELTAERFVESAGLGRLYRTGDYVRWRLDGALEFLGRRDEQVKLRGFRIERGEIEACLRGDSQVGEAAVEVRGEGDGRALVAYVAPRGGAGVGFDGLAARRRLRRLLPDYMVPARFVALERLPLTANGKVDRARLPLEPAADAAGSGVGAGVSPVEAELAELWSAVLGREGIGREDNFFDLGGHSLLATQLIARIRDSFAVEAALALVFEHPVLCEQAAVLERSRGGATLPAIARRPAGAGPAPLSFAQQRLWFLAQLQEQGEAAASYTIAAALRLDGELDVAALRRALRALTARQESLRASIRSDGGAPHIVLVEPYDPLEVEELGGLSGAAQDAAVRERAAAHAGSPFDLARDRLLRLRLLRLGPGRSALLFALHHIVGDAWSLGILVRELGALYAAACGGEAPALPPLPIQYVDYALWQREWLSGETLEGQLAYWRAELAGAPAVLELPYDHARPAVKSYRGGRVAQRIEAALAGRLKALGRRHGATLYMTLLAGFKALLHRLSGADDVVVGSPIANRRHSSVEGVIGFFVNTLVLRSRVDADAPFREVLRQVQRTALGAYAHQDVPFEALVSELSPERSLSHSPLFQVMFALQNAPMEEVRLGGVAVEALDEATRTAKFDLFLDMSEEQGELVGVWEYSADLFEAATVARLAESFTTLLEGVVADPDLAIGRLPLLSEGERARLRSFNATARPYPRDATLGELFALEAASRPEATALTIGDERVSYGELEARANRLAHCLIARLGPMQDRLVGLLLERSSDLIVAMLAVVRAGGAYLPLDLNAPAERLGFMLADAEALAVLSAGAVAAAAPAGAAPVILLDEEAAAIAACPSTPPARTAAAESLAYVMYTSGSTGRPKGVCVSHRAVVRLVKNADYARFSPAEVFLQYAPASFDASTFEIWGALLNGARLALMAPRQESLEALGRTIAEQGVTTLWLTASLFNLMIEEQPDALSGLKQLLVGGEALSAAHVRRARAALPGCRLINGYGPTEGTTFSCCHTITEVDEGASIPIGGPIANTEAHVLDARGELLPIGVAGELYIGGDGLARGYLGQPALTAERFVETAAFGRLYRTGDFVRWRPDGALDFLGRRDDQIKLRGFRIELGEIEAELRRMPRVRDAAVVARGESEHRELVAYLRHDGAEPGIDAVREHLRHVLPGYMMPAHFVVLDAYPQTASGKIDRRALPTPEAPEAAAAHALTPTEDVLAALWCRLLRRETIGPQDNFFELGGHSLLATQLVSRIRDTFRVALPLATIFTAQTLRELASQIEGFGHRPEHASAILPVGRAESLPLSFAQERLWFLHKLEPDNPFYNTPLALRLSGRLDRAALQGALHDLLARHEVLRTAFVDRGGKPYQVIAADLQLRLAEQDLSALPEAERDAALLARARAEAKTPFADLGAPPLVRTTLVKLAADRHALLLTFHHIVTDGWSLGVLGRDLAAFYNARCSGRACALPELHIQYADFGVWQRGWLKGEILDSQLAYWRRQLADAPLLIDLPTDHPRPPVQRFRGASIHFTVERKTRDALSRIGRERNATLFMTLLAGFACLLHRYSGQCDMVIGTPIAGRNRAETEGLLGFFVNTLALRVDLREQPRFADLIERVQRMALAAYAHQDVPFERLVDELQPERDLSRNPLFQVMFALQNTPEELADFEDLEVGAIPIERTAALFDLVLDAWDFKDGLHCVLEYNCELFDTATAARLVKHLRTLWDAFVSDPEVAIDVPTLLDAEERALVLSLSNGPCVPHPLDRSLTELFEAQVVRGPHRVAAVANGKSLDYGQLNEQANRLAHLLSGLGVAPGTCVGVLVPRGLDYLVSALGVIKAGGVFLPLDAGFPPDRLKYMIEDSAIAVVIAAQEGATLLESAAPPNLTDVVVLGAAADPPIEPHSGIRLHGGGALRRQRHDNPPVASRGRDLLYMMYTSGSTGVPKGALIRHDGALNHMLAEFRLLCFHPDSAFLQSAPGSSDISVWQCLGPLLVGGRVVIADFDTMCSPAALFALIRRERATLIELVPSVLEGLIDHAAGLREPDRALPDLEWAMVTGEAAPVALVNCWFHSWPHIPLVNAYGPTEAADDICQHVLRGPLGEGEINVPVGKPIDNLSVLLLDHRRALVPRGMRGEICVSGVGVGAGYWRQPQRTAEAFLDNPHKHETFGSVLYRTGDIGRWRDDGSLEFLGRMDNQVKVRGFRVELGEIEAALMARPELRDAIVVDHLDRHNECRLAAYVQVRARAIDRAAFASEQLQLWEQLHDASYGDTSVLDRDPAFNTIGWDSTYTGEPLTVEEMRECVDNAVSRILADEPRHLLEIGCGTGLLLYRLVPHCLSYLGTDLSARTIEQLRASKTRLNVPGLDRAELRVQRAEDFSGIAPGAYDFFVLNSVVQYFPSVDYLVNVLAQAVEKCACGGTIFIGDVRSLPLLRSYYGSVQWRQAEDEVTRAEFGRRIEAQFAREHELAIAPGFFQALAQHHPRLSSVAILPKRGRIHNEMTRFRYDVVLRVEAAERSLASPLQIWEDWRDGTPSSSAIGERLATTRPRYFGLRHVANARLSAEKRVAQWLADEAGLETVGALRKTQEQAEAVGVDPEALWELANVFPYDVTIRCEPESADGEVVVLFTRRDCPPVDVDAVLAAPSRPFADCANNPLLGNVARALVPELRRHLKATLPQHMIPASFVVLDRFPLLPNGKVDRRALPPPDFETLRRDGRVAPRTPTERVVQGVWAAVLGVENMSIHDNFFALGGHSLKVTQVVSRIAQELSKTVSLRDFFNHPTVAELAGLLDETKSDTSAASIPSTPSAPDYPASPAQQRLWVLAQMDSAAAYNMADSLLLRGDLDTHALAQAYASLLDRHETLRTEFHEIAGALRQQVRDGVDGALQVLDLRSSADPIGEARSLALADARTRFDLSCAPLVRVRLMRTGDREHVLHFNMHHIISDGWSMDVLIREIVRLYEAAIDGRAQSLPPQRIQYRDYVAWQAAQLGSRMERLRDYWRGQLGDLPPPLDLPADFPRPALRSGRGGRKHLRLEPLLHGKIVDFARERQVSMFMLLAALVKVLIYRYSGETDIAVGFPIAGREHPDLEGQIGLFANTLVLRSRLDDAQSFAALLEQIRLSAAAAYDHQDYPFDQLVQDLNPPRDPSRNPLFDVMLVLQNTSNDSLRLPGLEITSLGLDYGLTQFDLLWNFAETANGLHLDLGYSADLFQAETIEQMLRHWRVLVAVAVSKPETPIGRLPMLREEERASLLDLGSPVEGIGPRHQNIVEWFEAQAAASPFVIAVKDPDRQITYAELDARANALARRLRRTLGPSETHATPLVGLYLPRSADLIVGVLGVLKAGAAYVPIDVDAPQARVRFILKDSAASLLVTQRGALDVSPDLLPPQFWLDGDTAEGKSDNLGLPIPTDAAAYVIYTSGSTGEPKGVVVSHRNVVRLFTATTGGFGFGPDDVWSLFHSVAFDFSVWEIWGALLHGGRLVVAPYATTRDPDLFLDLLRRENVTVLNQTPSAFRQLARAEAACWPTSPLSLRYIIFGGEALDPSELASWFSRHGDASPQLVNMYGITETTVHVTYRALTTADAARPSSVIGGPIPDLYLYLLDRHLEPVPPGVPGELFVGGEGVAQGYLHRDQATRERFIADPHRDGKRLYRSGDRARRRWDGELEYLGRLDDQIKLRGFRIEPGEIGYVLRQHPAVRDAAVLLRGRGQDALLAAYYVPAGEVDESELRGHLQRSLPPHLIPAAFVAIPALPLTSNGKLDRRALPDPTRARPSVSGPDMRLARSTTEAHVLETWQKLLDHPALGLDDNVFDHGAHSVLVIQARNRLRDLLQRDISVAVLFQYPTAAGLAAELDRNDAADPSEFTETQNRATQRRAAAHGRRRNASSLAP